MTDKFRQKIKQQDNTFQHLSEHFLPYIKPSNGQDQKSNNSLMVHNIELSLKTTQTKETKEIKSLRNIN